MHNVLDIPKVLRRYSQKSVRFVHPIIKTVRTVCPSRISPYDLSKLLCLFPYTICLPYDMSADREKKILYMTLISTPPEGAGASESESLFSLVLRRLLAAWRKRLAAFNGKDYSQNSPPQDSPLGGNPEVGNPESISYQDYPPKLLCFVCIVCAWYGLWVSAGDTDSVFHHNILKNEATQ